MMSMSGNPVITPGNSLGMAINNLFATHHAQYKKVLVTRAKDSVKKDKVTSSVASKIVNWPATQTGQIPGETPFYIGMPVYLSKNMHVELGLTNGTKGVVRSIHLKNGRLISADSGKHYVNFKEGDYIIVEFDDIKVKPLPGLALNHIPITPQDTDFPVYVGNGKSVTVKRRHFPLVPRFSVTSHKSQGMTLAKAIVDLVPSIRKGRRNPDSVGIEFAYVPLSRVRTVEDLMILRAFDPSVLKIQVNASCFAMMEEFRARDMCKDM
jgi:ATP-dependent exoDNAse (exonuclease V) alpha subunit